MSTLILVCIFNISQVNSGTIRYMPLDAHIAVESELLEYPDTLHNACFSAFGEPSNLAYVQ